MMALHFVGRQRGDPMAAGGGGSASSSSIALLQERFRQLQKMRERREEMELLKLLSEQTKQYEQSGNLLVHPEMISHQPTRMTTKPSLQDSLSLGLDLYSKKTEHHPSKNPPFRDFWSLDSATVGPSSTHDKPDVDTSLHL